MAKCKKKKNCIKGVRIYQKAVISIKKDKHISYLFFCFIHKENIE